MEDDDLLPEMLAFSEAMCQLTDAVNGTTNKQVRDRLLSAMDLVLARFGPASANRRSSVIDVTGRNGS